MLDYLKVPIEVPSLFLVSQKNHIQYGMLNEPHVHAVPKKAMLRLARDRDT